MTRVRYSGPLHQLDETRNIRYEYPNLHGSDYGRSNKTEDHKTRRILLLLIL